MTCFTIIGNVNDDLAIIVGTIGLTTKLASSVVSITL